MPSCRKDSTGFYHLGQCVENCKGEKLGVIIEAMRAHEGLKYDTGKPQMELLSSIALMEVAKVLSFGAKKYDSHNWRKGIVFSRLLGACIRHVFAYLGGESKDPETGLSHLAHASCCLMFLLEFEATRPDLDDRYKPSSDTSKMQPPGDKP